MADNSPQRLSIKIEYRIAFTYLILGALWILFSDKILLTMTPDEKSFALFQTLKGWFFVFLTTLLLIYLVRKGYQKIKQSERAVAESEQRLNIALTSSGQGWWELDPVSRESSISSDLLDELGYENSEPSFSFWNALVHPEDKRAAEKILKTHIAGQIPVFETEIRLQNRNGEWRWFQFRGKAFQHDEGSQPYLSGTCMDITQQKTTEADSHESQRRLVTLMSNLPGIAYRCFADQFWTMTFVSEGCYELTGYKPVDLIQNRNAAYSDLIIPEDREYVNSVVLNSIENRQSFTLSYRIQTANQERKWVWEKGCAVSFDKREPILLEGFITDISDLKKTEEALYVRNLQYKSFVENSLVGIWRLDFPKPISIRRPVEEVAVQILDTGYFSECNDAMARMYGLNSREEFLGKNNKELVVNREESLKRISYLISNNFKIEILDSEEKDSRGRTIYIRNSYFGFVENDHLQWLWGLQMDITEQKRLEEQFLHAQKMEAVGQLAGGIAHDFNNLLSAILGYSELILDRLPDDSAWRKEITQIQKAGTRAASLTRQLLAFSRRQILQPRIVNLNEIVNNMYDMLTRLLGEHIELIFDLSPDIKLIQVDPGQIEQVIMNLAINARDAMENSGKLIVETSNSMLDKSYVGLESIEQEGEFVLLSVTDTGVGMDQDIQSHIFEPFFTTKELGKGTGLGLSTVYGIVRQSKGFIWVYSTPGEGTTFKVYFPVLGKPSGEPAPDSSVEIEAPPGGTETVLIVEDEETVRMLIGEILSLNGYQIIAASSGPEAIRLCKKFRDHIQLIISDVIMPGMNGPELMQECTQISDHFKVLYISGYTDNAAIYQKVMDSGVDFIQKPFASEILLKKVRNALDNGRQKTDE